jgi:hypothetical protein
VAVGDVNGDGWPDVAVSNSGPDGGVSVLLNDGVWTGPGPAPGGGKSPRDGTLPPGFDGFAADALVSRPVAGRPVVPPLQTWAGLPQPTNHTTPPVEQPAARGIRSAAISPRDADAFFAHGERTATDLGTVFDLGTERA